MKELKVTRLAEALKSVREDISEIELGTLYALKQEEFKIREDLLKELKVTGLGNIKLESGEIFTKAIRTSFSVTDTQKAHDWAAEKGLVVAKIDTVKANKVLKRELTVPEGFERVDTEYLQVRSGSLEANSEENEN